MWGFEYKMITTVALVRSIDHSSTKITYTLEDVTGRINAHLWVEEGDTPQTAGIMINTYARVIGAVRQQNDTKSVLIYKIQPVKSINEVNTHYLEVVNARYQAEEYHRGAGMDTAAGGVAKMEIDNGGFGDALAQGSSTQNGPAKGKDTAIFNAIQKSGETHPETGLSKQELLRIFPHIPEGEMTNILEKLAADGHTYSTIDSDHFLSCF